VLRLAKTLDEPFGRPGEAASTETVPVEMYVEQYAATGRDPNRRAVAPAQPSWRKTSVLLDPVLPRRCARRRIVRELREQVGIARALGRRLDDGAWAVSRDDLEQPAYPPDSAPTVDTEFDAEADGV
jgi:hypothetical protein